MVSWRDDAGERPPDAEAVLEAPPASGGTTPRLVRGDDQEFSQYYNLLRDRPGDLGIIPREPGPPLGGGSDCDNPAQIPIP